MWVGGVGWTQTFITHVFMADLTPFVENFGKFTVKITFCDPNLFFFRGWVGQFCTIVPNKTDFFLGASLK